MGVELGLQKHLLWGKNKDKDKDKDKDDDERKKKDKDKDKDLWIERKKQIDVKIKAARLIWPGGMSGAPETMMVNTR